MKMASALRLLLLLSALLGARAVPAPRPSCYKRALGGHGCGSIPQAVAALRPVDQSLQDHFWEGKGCDTICYCGLSELLCCPNKCLDPSRGTEDRHCRFAPGSNYIKRNIFFGPKISSVIPCNSQ